MGVKLQYVRQLKTGRLEYRRAFPKALRAYLGRNELIVTLEGTSLADTGVMERYRSANDNFERLVAVARKASTGVLDSIDRTTIVHLAEAFYAVVLELDDARRWATGDEREARFTVKTEEALNIVLPTYRHLQATGDLEGIVAQWSEEVELFSEAKGYRFDNTSKPFADLCRAFNEAAIRAGEAQLERLKGALIETPLEPQALAPKDPLAHKQHTFDALTCI